MDGAPLRAISVKDAIGDLPPIVNGSDMLEMPYSGARPPIFPHSLQACHSTGTCIEDMYVQNQLTSAAQKGLHVVADLPGWYGMTPQSMPGGCRTRFWHVSTT